MVPFVLILSTGRAQVWMFPAGVMIGNPNLLTADVDDAPTRDAANRALGGIPVEEYVAEKEAALAALVALRTVAERLARALTNLGEHHHAFHHPDVPRCGPWLAAVAAYAAWKEANP